MFLVQTNKHKYNMKQFGLDKVKHIIYAFIIASVVGIALKGGAAWSNIACALTGAATAEAALFAKEFYDKTIKGTKFDWADIQWGQIGVVAALLCVWLLI